MGHLMGDQLSCVARQLPIYFQDGLIIIIIIRDYYTIEAYTIDFFFDTKYVQLNSSEAPGGSGAPSYDVEGESDEDVAFSAITMLNGL